MANLLRRFRQLMALRQINIYVLPRTDEHQSEYICECDERVKFISGFSGSNGIALISQEEALLWTDGRYFLQADKELRQGWQLRKMLATEKKWFQHIVEKYPKGAKIGIDGRLVAAGIFQQRKELFLKNELDVDFHNSNLVDDIWEQRPKSTASKIFLHEEWAGKPMAEKVKWVRGKILEHKGQAAVFSDLSEIGWLLNLRSSQIQYNPFFKGILVLERENGTLYLPKGHESLNEQSVVKHLNTEGIEIKEYDPVYPEKILCKKSALNYSIYSQLKEPIQWPGIDLYRAVRAQKEIDGFTRCHIVDGIAQVKFWAWRSKQQEIDEYQAAKYIDALRLKQKHNMGLSFATISGGGANAAVIHYNPSDKVSSMITKDMIHLVDSGGQYLDGTTDVTRTYHFGNPTAQEKDSFTRVLLGNLDVERMKWPNKVNITGGDVDILARRHLYAKGLDFQHGTGHGVGYFQGVHQGPCGIHKNNQTVFKPGMIVTNQPGYYEPGKYGIRIENILLVVQNQGIISFQNLTLCPYDKNLLAMELLNQADKDTINNYHQRVWDTLAPLLEGDQTTLDWLKGATSPI